MTNESKEIGQRRSARRDAIVSVLQESGGALTPEQIQDEAAKQVPGLGIATVYRNLKLLQESGIANQIILPDGQSRFELANKKHHHHFQCDACGRAFCLDGCGLAHQKVPDLPKGFVVDGHEITYYGKCPACSNQA